jgi:hypothetical protein
VNYKENILIKYSIQYFSVGLLRSEKRNEVIVTIGNSVLYEVRLFLHKGSLPYSTQQAAMPTIGKSRKYHEGPSD